MRDTPTTIEPRFTSGISMTPTDPDRPLAISYLRFSTPEQGKGDSLRRQSRKAEEYAKAHGLELTDDLSFEDRGVSAYRGKNSAEGALAAIEALARSGAVPEGTYLLVESLDRLSRMDPFDAQYHFAGLIRAGLIVVTLVDEQVYSGENMRGQEGLMRMFGSLMIMSRANEESRTKSQRLSEVNENKRQAAYSTEDPSQLKRLTKIAPAWLTANPDTDKAGPEGWLIDDRKAAVVQRIFEMGRERVGKETVAKRLNAEGVAPLGRGKLWHASYVQKLWANLAVVGTHTPHRIEITDAGKKKRVPEAPIPGYFPAIVSDELWADVQALRAVSKPRGVSTGVPVRNPLAGVGKCGYCGATVTRVQKGSRSKPSLVCTAAKQGRCTGPYTSVKVEAVETALEKGAQYAVATAPLGEGTETLEAELQALTAALNGSQDLAVSLAVEVATAATPAKRQALRDAEATVGGLKADIEALEAKIVQNAHATVRGRMAVLERVLWREEGQAPATAKEVSEALQRACEAVVIDWKGKALLLRWRQGGESRIVWGWDKEVSDATHRR